MAGGEGGKSENIGRYLLIEGMTKRQRYLCARELQVSIKESVHHLLKALIEQYDLGGFYEVQATTIKGKNGTEFIFKGLKHNVTEIKSMNDIDKVWIEEAQNVSKSSWEVLIPTIRKDSSEILVSFNPDLEDDETYQRFVVSPPPDSWVKKMNWDENPWFPEVLKKELEFLKGKDHDSYLNVWEGHCKQSVDGAIFANELRLAAEQHRMTKVPIMPGIPVHTFWDLGQSDNTAIWFVQVVGLEYRLLDYYQSSGHKMQHYIEVLADRAYRYGEHCLPHDAEHEQIAAQTTIKQQLQKALQSNPKLGDLVRIVPRIPKKALGIDAARSIFGQCVFDKEKTADGLQCLRHYAYAKGDDGKVSKEPKHDTWSHGCLVGNSMVNTGRGLVAISEVTVEDTVWTPRGYAKVLASGPVKVAETLVDITMKDGRNLICTGEHKVLTQKGFLIADALLYSDRIYNGGELQCALISLISTVFGLGYRETITGKTNGHKKACKKRQNGTVHQRGLNGTKHTENILGRIESGANALVRSVGKNLCRLILLAPNGATQIAHLKTLKDAKELVYDLTIENHACYQANGLLVSNSDAFLCFAQNFKRPQNTVIKSIMIG